MQQDNAASIFHAFLLSTANNPGKAAIYYKKGSSYISLSYQELLLQSQYLNLLLDKYGINKGSHVALILENTPWWPISYLALMQRGAVVVPLYPQLEPAEFDYLLRHADAKLIIASSLAREQFKGTAQAAGIPVLTLETPYQNAPVPGDFHAPPPVPVSPGDTAMIVYTSGTTDAPKGVLLTHKNLLANVRALTRLNLMRVDDCFPSMLPLHHAYPFMANLLLPLLRGASISFVATLEAQEFFACIAQTPTNGIAAVPRLLSLLHEKINAGIAQKSPAQKMLLYALLGCASLLPHTARISFTKLLLSDLHKKFGPSFHLMISGGAKLDPVVAKAFDTWGFLILEGYGLTETSPVVCFNTPGHHKFGSVGRPLEGVTVTIDSPDAQGVGELCISGENLTPGYYKDPVYTAQVIRNGTFFSQDLGWIDKDGYVYITGRKNETIVLSSGKKINPEELEAHYRKSPFIREICVSIDAHAPQQDLLIALIVPDLAHFRKEGLTQTKDRIRWELESYSKTLPAYKRITQFVVNNDPLPKTLLGKIKRFEVAKTLACSAGVAGAQKPAKELSAEDRALMNFPLCQKALEYLSQRAKKPVYPENHLELDLGLDSLERISLFFEFQKLSGNALDESLFFYVATVRDVLTALLASTGQGLPMPATIGWNEILNAPLEKEAQRQVKLSYGPLLTLVKIFEIALIASITHSFFWLRVKGKHNIPRTGPCILAANHTSFLDPFLVGISLPFANILRTYYLGYQGHLSNPMISWAKHILGTISIDSGYDLDKSLRLCAYVLRNGKTLCIFPEGTRSLDDNIQEFKSGVAILAKELNIPVIPVHIKGAFDAWPTGQMFPRPGRISVTFGTPLTPEKLSRAQKDGVDIYQNIAHNLREEVAKL